MMGLNMPGTTLSRCIVCMIWPKLPSEVVDDFDECDDKEFKILRSKLARWSADNAIALRSATPESSLNNRMRMNWKVLLAIADLAGGGWPKRARTAALEMGTNRDEPSEGVRLLGAIRDLMGVRKEVTSAHICKALPAAPSSEWSNFRGKGPISQAQLAALLRPYGIRPVTLHPTKRAGLTRHGYQRSQFDNAWARLLQKPSKDPHIRTSDADPAFDSEGNTDCGLHGDEAVSDQRRLGHQAESKVVRRRA
jgi:putative DNA primase/helicase